MLRKRYGSLFYILTTTMVMASGVNSGGIDPNLDAKIAGLEQKTDDLEIITQTNKTSIDGMNMKYNVLEKVISSVNGKINFANQAISENESLILKMSSKLENNIVATGNNKADLQSNKTDIQNNKGSIQVNVEDIAKLKLKTSNQETTISENKTSIEANKSDIQNNKGSIQVNVEDIAKLKLKTSNQETAISENKTSIEANKSNIQNNKNIIQENTINIANIKATDDKQDEKIETNRKNIENLKFDEAQINNNTLAIENTNNRIDELDEKVNRGLSLMTAMSSLDFGNLEEHKLRTGAAIGNYSNSRAIAIGVAIKPTTDVIVNAKYSVSAEDIKTSAMGVGITYDFDI